MATIPDPTPTHPSTEAPRSPRGRWRPWCAAAVVLLTAAGVAGWRYTVTRPAYRLARGEDAVRAGDWDAAGYYIDRLEEAGHADEAHFLRGQACLARAKMPEALREFDAVGEDSPLRLRAATQVGRCLLGMGALREAHAVFTTVVRKQPDDPDAHRGLAAIAYDLGQYGDAIEHLGDVARLDPADGRPHRLIGRINKDMGQHERAEPAYREALRRGLPTEVAREAARELAETLVELSRFADALAVLDERPADDAEAAAARAAALRGLNRRAEAVDVVEGALTRSPTAVLYRLRGQLAVDAGDPRAAVAPLERAAELAPADYRSHLLLAQVYAGVGRDADAKRESARAEELRRDLDQITALSRRAIERPWDAEVRNQLADLSERLGLSEVARTWRRAAAACREASR